jgi:hypothetical protein
VGLVSCRGRRCGACGDDAADARASAAPALREQAGGDTALAASITESLAAKQQAPSLFTSGCGFDSAKATAADHAGMQGAAALAAALDTPVLGLGGAQTPAHGAVRSFLSNLMASASMDEGKASGKLSTALIAAVGDGCLAAETASCVLKMIKIAQRAAKRKRDCLDGLDLELQRETVAKHHKCAECIDEYVLTLRDRNAELVGQLSAYLEKIKTDTHASLTRMTAVLDQHDVRDGELDQSMRKTIAAAKSQVKAVQANAHARMIDLVASHEQEMRRHDRDLKAKKTRSESILEAFGAAIKDLLCAE